MKKKINVLLDRLLQESLSIMEQVSDTKRAINEASLEQFKQAYVGDGKTTVKVPGRGKVEFDKVSEDVFDKITSLTMTIGSSTKPIKPNFVGWILKQVIIGNILEEDIYKYGDEPDEIGYFSMFIKAQRGLSKSDINQYKDAREFRSEVVKTYEKAQEFDEEGDKYVSVAGIKELKSVGISLIGNVAGYQCFKLPEGNYDEEVYRIYRKHLAKCHGRKISICTMGRYDHFQRYTGGEEAGDNYIFFNQDDEDAPYQFNYEAGHFMDREDHPVTEEKKKMPA